ncbi:Macrophage receptor MARCO [Stylophora pistillata]|uniref:Macrophage receptor MARCO n=1 Tax=Stylophora pistillata TaxID=50429 RepID=A0A2B4RN82_STYPI|nr:Macrophage receptor MARCO [Stylophora pistillata]
MAVFSTAVMWKIVFLLLVKCITLTCASGTDIGGDIVVDTNLTLNGTPYTVTQDLIVAENATLSIQPGVQLHFDAAVSLKVKGSLVAKGNPLERIVFTTNPTNTSVNSSSSRPSNFTYNEGIRLRDGSNHQDGRLEIFMNGQWGTVCDDAWDIRDTQVACRQLRFQEAKRFYTFGGGTGPIWLDDVECNGHEMSLLHCRHRGIGSHNCGHGEDIGIECQGLKYPIWNGIEFIGSKKRPVMKYVHISHAHKAISGNGFLPHLDHVTIQRSVFGVMTINGTYPLTISNSSVKNNSFTAIYMENHSGNVTIENTVVEKTMVGHGLQYLGIASDSVDFCSFDDNSSSIASFPINFQALGKAYSTIDCAKMIRIQPGKQLVVQYESTSGTNFELQVHDGNTTNATTISFVNQLTGVVPPSLSSGHELFLRFRYSGGGSDAKVRFIMTSSQVLFTARIVPKYIDDIGGGVRQVLSNFKDPYFLNVTNEKTRFTSCASAFKKLQILYIGDIFNPQDPMDTSQVDCCSLVIFNSSFSDNQGRGIFLKDFVGNLDISETKVFRNGMDGLMIERTHGKITMLGSHFIDNSANGLGFLDSSFLSYILCQLFFKGNGYNGLNVQRVAFKGKISDSEFTENGYNGLVIASGTGEVVMQNVLAILNKQNGVMAYDGKIATEFKFCNFSRNQKDGCYIANQAGSHQLYNCSANSNSRCGISLSDPIYYSSPNYHFKGFILKDSTIQNNALFGIKFSFGEKNPREYGVNPSIVIKRNSFVGNSRGGIVLSSNYRRWYWNDPRKIDFVVNNNLFEQNKANSIYVNCFSFLGSNSLIESNKFVNNSDGVVTFLHDNNCKPDRKGNPIIVTINGNTFTKNRVDNVIYIDYNLYPETRSASIGNNTFEDNEPPTKELFPNFFLRLTSHAVIVLKEGNFTVHDNIFENPSYTFQISSLLRDHHRVVDAEMNWWGTADGCEIMDRVFDFQHNAHLSQFQFFPYYTSLDKSAVSTSRPYCFLRGSSIGGSLDRLLTLSNADSPYDVRQDVVILTNGTLVIPKNVTLRFPPRSVMVVKGKLIVNGTDNEKVRFSTKPYQEEFRLAGGAGPWEGRVDFLVNNTWSPVCVSYYRSFTSESKIICQQFNLYYQTYWFHSPTGQGSGFVHNVICDENIDNDIMNCSVNTWSYRPSCTGYTVHVTCQQYNWAGLHLAMTNHQSLLRYVEILDAGFAYRSDIQISGAALTIDLNHHNISNIFINNSLGIGVKVVYQSFIHYASLIPQSTISYTKSHGVLSYSPSLVLTDINMTRNDGNGFIFKGTTSSWDSTRTFTAKMASRDMDKYLYICSHNKTFLSAEKVFYFSLEALEDSLRFRCQHVLETEPGYIILIQELYTSTNLDDYHIFLHVYNGDNMSLGIPFKLGSSSLENRPVFNSVNSSILFDFFKHSGFSEDMNFLVYTVKGSQNVVYVGEEIKIARAKIANSLQGGILIGGRVLKHLCDNAAIVIYRYTGRGTFDIRSNNFTLNSGRCLFLGRTVPYVQLTVTNNLFRENYCKNKSVIEILRMDENNIIESNIFINNRANSVVLLQVMYDIHLSLERKMVAFKNNTLFDNVPYSETQSLNERDSCAVVLSGILGHKETEFYFNSFNNTRYLMELCVKVLATSEYDVVNLTYNWWGTANESKVRERIWDFDDNYDFAVANISPVLLINNEHDLISFEQHNLTQTRSILSGRLIESLTLKPSQSPYFVPSDFIVTANVTLTIQAGVIVKVSPGKRVLVAGTLQALGTFAKPVIFTVKEPTEDNIRSQFPLRLVDGDFPWKGRAELFYNKSWKPITVSNILAIRNITRLLCHQLGYGPGDVSKGKSHGIGQDGKGSWMVEISCFGHETGLQECLFNLVMPNETTALQVVKCEGLPWGNVRFVPPRDKNTSNLQSVLNHVQFSNCGNRHGAAVPAIEIVNRAPKLQFVTVKNCTSGGLRIFSARTDIHLNHCTFINTGGTGISFVETHQSIMLDSLESSKNLLGASFEEPNRENIPRVFYGRVFVCGAKQIVHIKKLTYLYFDTAKLKDAWESMTCLKVLTVSKGHGIKVTLLHTTGTHRVRIYDSGNFGNLILDSSYGSLNAFVGKALFILRDAILLQWTGDTNSEIVVEVEDINVVGKVLLAGSDYYWDRTGGLAAMISPPITKQSQWCTLVYFYRLRGNGDAVLSVYAQTGTFSKIDHRLIWRSTDDYVWDWRKVVIDLPSDIDEYRLLLVARYNSSSYYYSRNYVAVDNLLLSGCLAKEHRISNSVFSGNQHQAINYVSTTGSSDNPPYLTIERCKVTDGSFSNLNPKTSIFLDIHDTEFAITNNFIFGNHYGGVTVRAGRSEGTSSSRSLVFGNTFSSNENRATLELRKQGNTANYSFIYIKDNAFESNSGYGFRIVRVSDVACEIVNNFLYNNSGLYLIDYQLFSPWLKGQRCELNSFYHNQGSITINSNGPVVYRRNVFENPSNLYEFSSTSSPVTDPIDAAQNWWGSGNESLVSLRIYDKNDYPRLATV